MDADNPVKYVIAANLPSIALPIDKLSLLIELLQHATPMVTNYARDLPHIWVVEHDHRHGSFELFTEADMTIAKVRGKRIAEEKYKDKV